MENRELMNKLYDECGLDHSDVFKSKHFTIITRGGIEKIMYNKGIGISYDVVTDTDTKTTIRAEAFFIDSLNETYKAVETFGEWNITHAKKNKAGEIVPYYAVALAEKRAKSRAVLMLMNLYEHHVLGEDEEIFDVEDASYKQIQLIENLLQTSIYDEDQKQRLESELDDMSTVRASEVIDILQDNQKDPIKSGENYSQTEIKNYGK